MANDTIFELPEIPGVTFTASYGSGGETGLPSNWIRIVGTVENPWYDPTYNYGLDPNGHTEMTDPWKRHTQFPTVLGPMGFEGPSIGLPTDPPPPPVEPEPTPDLEEPTVG
ncbi:hypothetical protein SEA_BLINO_30 [Gordonia phage Blino]|uniref:Uncharacterized protein n=1 Tax=Gordonia phage Blino TaxID=2793696 RepID=A0A7T0M0T7_9CAUD|nr:hypothetical protein BIZ75_gp30 [Gordonia phage CarolAnn]YP_010114119.1 hypothetical protein KNV70_gp30 [Gordonia phage Blino]AOE44047.1 hypothetical protein SEA_CAROLANN_30 [Gordonia phage CarolAnn]QPL13978.1 hypothetical protein SEA_BLINO_30 [Gordonia phage Blino]